MFSELDEEAVTGVDCDGMVFDPNNFKAVREVNLFRDLPRGLFSIRQKNNMLVIQAK